METDQADPSDVHVCSICGGSGELMQIDEDVGCCITVPCWACRNAAPDPERKDAPSCA